MEKAVDYLRRLVPHAKRIAIETAFIPLDSAAVLRKAFRMPKPSMRYSFSNVSARVKRRKNSRCSRSPPTR